MIERGSGTLSLPWQALRDQALSRIKNLEGNQRMMNRLQKWRSTMSLSEDPRMVRVILTLSDSTDVQQKSRGNDNSWCDTENEERQQRLLLSLVAVVTSSAEGSGDSAADVPQSTTDGP